MVRIIERRGEVCIIPTLYALATKLSMIIPNINLPFCSIKSKKSDTLFRYIMLLLLCPFVGMGLFAPQFGGVLDFQQTSDLGAVHQGDEISSSYSPSCGPSSPSGAGVVSVPSCGAGGGLGGDVSL